MFKLISSICFFIVIVLNLNENNYVTANVLGEAWVSRARVINGQTYLTNVMQELCYELERRGWSNIKMIDVNKSVDAIIANWHVNGTVLYTNGFVISIQKIDVSSFTSQFSRVIADNVLIPSVSIRGRLHFRDINIGYDVIANMTQLGVQRYTGEILNTNIAFDFMILKNLITQAITVSSTLENLQGTNIRMIYSPTNRVTEVLSRNFGSSDNWGGATAWRESFNAIILDIVNNKIEFPRICFNDC